MLTYNEASLIGINACLDRIGRDFVERFRENSCNAFADVDDHAFCFVGVSDQPNKGYSADDPIVLDGEGNTEFTYRVSCNVRYSNGKIEFLECVLP